jgi:hypothetical protein
MKPTYLVLGRTFFVGGSGKSIGRPGMASRGRIDRHRHRHHDLPVVLVFTGPFSFLGDCLNVGVLLLFRAVVLLSVLAASLLAASLCGRAAAVTGGSDLPKRKVQCLGKHNEATTNISHT